MAHTDESFFQAAHEVLSDDLPETTIVSLHFFLEPGASVSNGKTQPTTPDSPSAQVTDAMALAFPNELVTSCNDYGAGNHDPRICGTTNTQGRYLNGSPDACGTGASSASGRFIHLEQNATVVNQPGTVAAALDTVF